MVDETTVSNWERGYTPPPLRYMPKALKFLGHDPALSKPETLGEKLLKYRRKRGITQKELAWRIGIDPTALSSFERSREKRHFRSVLQKLDRYLAEMPLNNRGCIGNQNLSK